jgi:hypothetical protein
MDPSREKEKRTPKEDLDRRSASSHDSKKCGARSVEKQGGMAFGFPKTATAVIIPDRQTDRQTDRQRDRRTDRRTDRQTDRQTDR